jgi:hypothetical protein
MSLLTKSNSKLYKIGSFINGYHTGVISGVFTMSNFIQRFGYTKDVTPHKGRIVSLQQLGVIVGIGVSFWIDYCKCG